MALISQMKSADISEDNILKFSREILDILLSDRTTGRNIIWATDNYEVYGASYNARFPVTIDQITGTNSDIICPRVEKAKGRQLSRTKEKAEVFTTSWICNEQNNLIDTQWFGKEDVFNVASHGTWVSTKGKIVFPDDGIHTWEKYVDDKRLELACGEAPYLVSRYDTVTGKYIPIEERIGLLDRKLRVVNENAGDREAWLKWTRRAFESIYGFEYQGDNVLLARENLLFTFIDYFEHKFHEQPVYQELKDIAVIISWNIWQMDGLTYTVPFQGVYEQFHQVAIGEMEDETKEPCYCRIKDWRSKKTVYFKSLIEKESE